MTAQLEPVRPDATDDTTENPASCWRCGRTSADALLQSDSKRSDLAPRCVGSSVGGCLPRVSDAAMPATPAGRQVAVEQIYRLGHLDGQKSERKRRARNGARPDILVGATGPTADDQPVSPSAGAFCDICAERPAVVIVRVATEATDDEFELCAACRAPSLRAWRKTHALVAEESLEPVASVEVTGQRELTTAVDGSDGAGMAEPPHYSRYDEFEHATWCDYGLPDYKPGLCTTPGFCARDVGYAIADESEPVSHRTKGVTVPTVHLQLESHAGHAWATVTVRSERDSHMAAEASFGAIGDPRDSRPQGFADVVKLVQRVNALLYGTEVSEHTRWLRQMHLDEARIESDKAAVRTALGSRARDDDVTPAVVQAFKLGLKSGGRRIPTT